MSTRGRDWDTESRSGGGGGQGRSYTVKRYHVPDRVVEDDRTEIRVTRREEAPAPRERDVREYRFEREVERELPSRPRYRTREASPPEREWIIEREVTREPPRRDPYELERYSRTTDYYSRPEAPQPIIIRQEAPRPIIIREREPTQEIVLREREEKRPEPKYEEERQVIRREEPREEEEDYYYQRTTRQLARRGDDYENEDRYRRDVGPRDSASQYARSEYSEDEYYYRRSDDYSDYEDGHDNDHRRHLAEGAVAGLGAAALLRHHKKRQGEQAGGVGQLLGGAALGTIGAELITRARSQYDGNRSRSRSRGRNYRGGRREERSRSRSESKGPGKLAKLGAVAAIGAVAAYALTRQNKAAEKQEIRRSRSRRRRGSSSRARSISSDPNDKKHKTSIMAKAGLATAAVAGLVERARSKSRGKDDTERSRIRQGAPIVAAGLGGAALAGLYESNKAQKLERKAKARADSSSSGSRSRSRSRSKTRSKKTKSKSKKSQSRTVVDPAYTGAAGVAAGPLVEYEYGGAPIPADDVYARPRSRADSYYSDAPGFRTSHRHGSPGSSVSSSPPRRAQIKERSQSRGRDSVTAAAAGAAAHEADQRRERRRAQRERRRQEEEGRETPNGGPYAFGPYAQAPPPPPAAQVYPTQQAYSMQQERQAYPAQQEQQPYPTQQEQMHQYYPQSNTFPPPPTQNVYSPGPGANYTGTQNAYTPYAPPTPAGNFDGRPDAAAAASIPGDPYFLNHPQRHDLDSHPGAYNHEDHDDRRRANNVSNAPSAAPLQDNDADHIKSSALTRLPPALKRSKSVQFDLPTPEAERYDPRKYRPGNAGEHDDLTASDSPSPERRRKPSKTSSSPNKLRKKGRPDEARPRSSSMVDNSRDKYSSSRSSRRHRSASPAASVNSNETIVLPDRFDRQGRKKPERGDDPLADKIQNLLSGQGTMGKLLQKFTGDLLGGSVGSRR